jgi:hypothetical protein
METEKSRFTQEKETLFITLYCKAREGRVEVPGGIENSKPYTRMETDASTTALSVLDGCFRYYLRSLGLLERGFGVAPQIFAGTNSR